MNYGTLRGVPVQANSCGRTAVANRARSGWASALSRGGKAATVQDVTDLHALARQIRSTWP